MGGRIWSKQSGQLSERFLDSTEVFDVETETWSEGPNLPTTLAFATAVTTPLATFIVGGQFVGGDLGSVTGQILKLDYDNGEYVWEVLPYQLSTPRRALAAISLNTDNFRHFPDEEADCATSQFEPIALKVFYQRKPNLKCYYCVFSALLFNSIIEFS